MLIYILSALIIISALGGGLYAWKLYQKRAYIRTIIAALQEQRKDILKEKSKDGVKTGKQEELEWKLLRASISKDEFFQIKILIYTVSLLLLFAPYFYVSLKFAVFLAIIAIGMIIYGPELYLDSAKNERVKKIDHDLSTFLDLVIIILEAGGGLKNALNEVSRRAEGMLSKDLIQEIRTLETELTNYSATVAYDNLVKRTGSKYLSALVDFLKLADETGIGVKTIFESQSKEIKEEEFFQIEKKSTTINLYLTMIVFVFLIPALGAFIIFPMMAGQLMGNSLF